MADLTQQAGRKNQSKRTSMLFNHLQRLTTKSFHTGALIWPSKQAERIKAEDWFDPASRQKKSKQKNMQVIHPSTMVDYEKLPSRCTDLTQQAGRKNQSKRTSKLFNHPQRSTTKSFQTGALIWPSKQTEKIKAKEQASYSTIPNGRLRKAPKHVHWFEPRSRQKESKQKNKQGFQPSITVHYEMFQAGALIWPSNQAERIKANEQESYSTIHNGRLWKDSKQVHWFVPASRQKAS